MTTEQLEDATSGRLSSEGERLRLSRSIIELKCEALHLLSYASLLQSELRGWAVRDDSDDPAV